MLAGALAIHATLVTRANGVWASVHSFVGNEEARQYNDPYIRIVQLFDDGAAGLEVAAYFLIMISLCFAAFLWLVKQQEKLLNSSSKSSMIIENPQLSIVLLIATIALGIFLFHQQTEVRMCQPHLLTFLHQQ